jgi:hypothetical protein
VVPVGTIEGLATSREKLGYWIMPERAGACDDEREESR